MDFSDDLAFHQACVAQADADLDCCCIHSSRDSLKPSSIQTAVLSKFHLTLMFCKSDVTP